ncbi:MAG: hypothetical protein KC417_09620, partial [Myxococcales bacterium]|nr:hypothetical protein [Myxococcales bacterium]
MDAPSRPTRAETAIAVLFLVAIAAVIAPRLMGGWDFWWHMAVGREAWATRTTLPTDPFSFSFEGAAWPYKDLLAGLLFYGAHAAGGMFGVVLLRATCVALIGVAFARLGAIRRSPTVVWIIAAGAYLVAVENTFIGRPQTFSLTCLPA